MRYYLLSLGCQMNLSDTERISAVLDKMGYQRSEDEEEAEVLGIVACSVRQKAIDRVYSRIHKWNKRKLHHPVLTFASGCILPADRQKFLKLFDLVFSIDELPSLPQSLSTYGVPTPISLQVKQYWDITPRYSQSFEAYVPIQNGCDKFCTFCAVPYTRGREVSRPSEKILEEITTLVDKDYKTITILGQNVNSYGLDDSKEISFAQLLQKIGELGKKSKKEFLVYFTSPHPRDMSRKVLEMVQHYSVLAKNIHLPIQSGDDKVLIRMNRNYRMSEYRKVVESIRTLLPSRTTLFTDIIVGFTGETETQFQETVSAVREFRYNMAYISQYSPRPGAASYRWVDDVLPAEKQKRYHYLSEVLKEVSTEQNELLIGSTQRILVTGTAKPGILAGRTEGRIPAQFSSTDQSLIGSFQDIHIVSAKPFSLKAELIS